MCWEEWRKGNYGLLHRIYCMRGESIFNNNNEKKVKSGSLGSKEMQCKQISLTQFSLYRMPRLVYK